MMNAKKIILLILLFYAQTYLFAQNIVWDNQLGGSGVDDTYLVSIDFDDNVYTAGRTSGPSDMDPGPNTFTLDPGLFIQKVDAAGNFVWAKGILENGNSLNIEKIIIDSAGNVYSIGYFEGTVDFDPGVGWFNLTSLAGNGKYDIYIQKLDINGDFIWAKSISGGDDKRPSSILLNPDHSSIFVSGQFYSTVDFDPGPGTYNLSSATSTDSDKFLLKLDSSGSFVWAKSFGGTYNNPRLNMLRIDDLGHLHAYGTFTGTVDFDLGLGVHNETAVAGLGNFFLLELDSNANFLNFNSFTFNGSLFGGTIKFDTDYLGNLYFGGKFSNSLVFNQNGNYPVTFNGNSFDVVIFKVDSIGNFIWARAFGSPNIEEIRDVVVDSEGYVYTTGQFSGEIDFDPSYGDAVYDGTSGPHAYVHKLDPNGNFVWMKHLYANVFDSKGLALDSDLNVYVAGNFGFGNALGGSYFLNGGTGKDLLILKLEQDSCSNMLVHIDSVADMTCSNLGLIQVTGLNGLGSYSYLWDNPSASTSSSIVIDSPGVYTVTVTDSIGCSKSKSILINGPLNLSNSSFDLNSNLVATTFRTGEVSTLQINAFNHGCLATNGMLTVVLSPLITYDSASILPDYINGDTLRWNFSNLIYGGLNLNPIIYVRTSISAQIGDLVCLSIQMSPESGDIDISNNRKDFCFPVVNSYDPNLKAVYPQGVCLPRYVLLDEKMTYMVRFQNTGNASAIDINILDTLSNDLDISSIQVVGVSHPQLITEILPGNVVRFEFENIYLPDSASNEPASHGYVIFRINPTQAILDSTLIENRVHIYFDYNDPIETNKVFNNFVDSIPNANIVINQNIDTLWASIHSVSGTYQWVDCNNGNQDISGANNPYFIPSQNGSYAVEISENNCSVLSDCYAYNYTGLISVEQLPIRVFPNPTNEIVNILLEQEYDFIEIEIRNVIGELISYENYKSTKEINTFINQSAGIYFLNVRVDRRNEFVFKIIKH